MKSVSLFFSFLTENTEQSSLLAKESIPLQTIKTEPAKNRERKDASSKTLLKDRQRSPHRTDSRDQQLSQASEKRESKFTNTITTVFIVTGTQYCTCILFKVLHVHCTVASVCCC